jgi:hypothetical protein
MRNEEVIVQAAKKIVDENNKIYKVSARGVAYIIYATDGNSTQDTFITNKNTISQQDWKNKFESVGFTNVVVKPFGTKTLQNVTGNLDISGDLDFSEVTGDLFTNATSRPKINYSEKPTRQNPYAGTQDIPTDSRITPLSHDDTNELQSYIVDALKSEEERLRAGWYGGSLVDWLNKIQSDPEGKSIKEILDKDFPYMNNSMLEKHLIDRQLSLADYQPSKNEIRYFAIVMKSLAYYILTPGVEFIDVPENKVKEELNSIIKSAKSFKKHKYYGEKEMGEYFAEHQNRLVKRQTDTRDAITLLMKGMFQ